MAQLIESKIAGLLTGATREGILTPVPLDFSLCNQDSHLQLTVVVEPTDTLKVIQLPVMSGGGSTAQTLLMLRSDQDFQVRLNATPELTFSVSANGPMVLPGLPEVTQLEFSGVAGVDAKVFITKLVGTQSLPAPPATGNLPPAGTFRMESLGTATAGQTAFTLPSTPTNPSAVVLFVEGIQYSESGGAFTVAGAVVTWNDSFFVMPLGARVEAYYQ